MFQLTFPNHFMESPWPPSSYSKFWVASVLGKSCSKPNHQCGAQELHPAVREGEVPVPSFKFSSYLDQEPPFSLCSLTRTWKMKKQHIVGRQGRSTGLRNTSPKSLRFLEQRNLWSPPISCLTRIYSAVLTPASLRKARVVEKTGRVCLVRWVVNSAMSRL